MKWTRWLRRAARLALAAQLCLMARSARAAPTEITYWSWNDDSKFVEKFNQTHPEIRVKFEKVPSANYEAKLLAAVKAGAGPDVMMEQYQFLPTVLVGGAVADLVPLGAKSVKARYPQWLWNQVQFGDGVYAVPLDVGPLAFVYRADVFEKVGIAVPKTWAEFATAAEKLRAAEPDLYMTMFATNEPAWFAAVASQGGARWFRMAGDSWQVTIDDAATRKVAAFWQDLVARKLVLAEPIWTDAWYSQLQKGQIVAWVAPAWGPAFLNSTAPGTAGKWKAAPVPQWDSKTPRSANWGGSGAAVSVASKNQKAAAQFAIWFASDLEGSVLPQTEAGSIFPAQAAALKPAILDRPYPFLGGQPVNQVYAEMAKIVDKEWQFPPNFSKLVQVMGDGFGKAAGGQGTFPDVVSATQRAVIDDLKTQGISVK
jgi:multiple sugar transport system substrate-binding protein